MNFPEAIESLNGDAASRCRALCWFGDWVRDLCLLHGTSMRTAYKVAGLFVEGLELDRERT